MSISDSLLPEFDQECAWTRKVLERCPTGKFQYKPHVKSWELVKLATHLANLPAWVTLTLKADSFDLAPPGGAPYKEDPPASTEALLALFDKNVAEARANLVGAADGEFSKNWSLLHGGQTLFTMPKFTCVRTFCFNHGVFHRGQATVYLRLLDIPVPALYGPSADEEN